MRPRTLEEFVGQEQLRGAGGALEAVVGSQAPLPSLILWGPPGSGKTTLASLLASHARYRFAAVSAVMAGVKELRAEIAERLLADAAKEERLEAEIELFDMDEGFFGDGELVQ